MVDRVPPQNIEAEEAVLGALLIDPDAILRIRHILSPTDFYREKHGWIYEACLALLERREPIDFLTLCAEMEQRGQLDNVGGPVFLTTLINAVPTSIHAEYYANVVSNAANNRRLIDMATTIIKVAWENGDSTESYNKAAQLLRDVDMSGKAVEASGGDNLVQEMLGDLAEAQREADRRKAHDYEAAWPWPQMRSMARWRMGQPAALLAEGGAGKTAFCTAVGTYNAINGGRVFYIATEDTPSILRKRMMSSISGIPFRQIESTAHDKEGLTTVSLFGVDVTVPAKLLSSIRSIGAWRGGIYFLSASGKTIPEIVYDLSRLEMDVGRPDAVIMDWFLDHKQRPSENVTTGLMADLLELKNYSAEHRTCLLIATQTGKAGAGKRLGSYDAYYTSSFAHYGKLVMSLKRERELVNGEAIGEFKPEIEVFISKANLDKTGSFKLMMRGDTLSIFEPEWEIKKLGSVYDD